MNNLFFFIPFLTLSFFSAIGQNIIANIDIEKSIKNGARIYKKDCRICHKTDGLGKIGKYPPLANSDWLKNNPIKAIKAIKYGLEEEIIVNNITYNNQMKARSLNDQQIVDVMNYILNSWGNESERAISISDVIE